MAIKRASHCVYDMRYHLVWAPKYRKWVLHRAIWQLVKELFQEIARHHEFEIEELVSIPPKYSIGQVVGLFKAVSVREIRAGFPEVRKQLWVESFRKMDILCGPWGIQVAADVIKKYIRFHEAKKRHAEQLKMF